MSDRLIENAAFECVDFGLEYFKGIDIKNVYQSSNSSTPATFANA
jgi:hypothetical protein